MGRGAWRSNMPFETTKLFPRLKLFKVIKKYIIIIPSYNNNSSLMMPFESESDGLSKER